MRAMDDATPNSEHAPGAVPKRAPLRGFLRWLPAVLCALAFGWVSLSLEIFAEGSRHLRELESMSRFHRDYREFSEAETLLKTGSDRLTQAVRRFAATGFPRFIDAYEAEEKVDRHRDRALAIIDAKLPPDHPARDAMHEAMESSLALQDVEHRSMRLVAEAFGMDVAGLPEHLREVVLSPEEAALDAAGKRQRAFDLLYSDDYFAAKAAIWSDVQTFLDQTIGRSVDDFDAAAQETIRTVTRQMLRFTLALACVFALMLVSAFVGYARFSRLTRENLGLVDDLRRERDATLDAQKARSLFFSMVSHDIRTPLNAIVGYSQMLRDGAEDPKERAEGLENILFSAQTLLALVNDVLDLSKLDAEKMRFSPAPCDFPALLRHVAGTFRLETERKGVEMRVSCGGMPRLVIDEERVRQVLVNLVSNAVKFTDAGFVEVAAEFADGTLRFRVADTGCGIAPEDRPRVLEPFVQVGPDKLRAGGTGLGLPICKSLLEKMGGSLSLESELGKGSTFSAELPGVAVAPEEKTTEHTESTEKENAGAAPSVPSVSSVVENKTAVRSVLVVDDVPVNLMVEQALLRRAGVAEIVTAASGADALAALEKHGAFDLVLSDLWMPEMDGYELCAKLRADRRWKALPVYAVTADVEARKSVADRGFDGILLKPVTVEALGSFLASLAK